MTAMARRERRLCSVELVERGFGDVDGGVGVTVRAELFSEDREVVEQAAPTSVADGKRGGIVADRPLERPTPRREQEVRGRGRVGVGVPQVARVELHAEIGKRGGEGQLIGACVREQRLRGRAFAGDPDRG